MSAQSVNQQRGEPALFVLTRCSIGIWTPRRKQRCLLLSLPGRKLFVVLLHRDFRSSDTEGNNHLAAKALARAEQILDARNPFSCGTALGSNNSIRVVALEIPWAEVVGIDYMFPLHCDGRLVLEARTITKRMFRTMADAQHFYSWQPGSLGPGTSNSSLLGDPDSSRRSTHAGNLQHRSQQQGNGGGSISARASFSYERPSKPLTTHDDLGHMSPQLLLPVLDASSSPAAHQQGRRGVGMDVQQSLDQHHPLHAQQPNTKRASGDGHTHQHCGAAACVQPLLTGAAVQPGYNNMCFACGQQVPTPAQSLPPHPSSGPLQARGATVSGGGQTQPQPVPGVMRHSLDAPDSVRLPVMRGAKGRSAVQQQKAKSSNGGGQLRTHLPNLSVAECDSPSLFDDSLTPRVDSALFGLALQGSPAGTPGMVTPGNVTPASHMSADLGTTQPPLTPCSSTTLGTAGMGGTAVPHSPAVQLGGTARGTPRRPPLSPARPLRRDRVAVAASVTMAMSRVGSDPHGSHSHSYQQGDGSEQAPDLEQPRGRGTAPSQPQGNRQLSHPEPLLTDSSLAAVPQQYHPASQTPGCSNGGSRTSLPGLQPMSRRRTMSEQDLTLLAAAAAGGVTTQGAPPTAPHTNPHTLRPRSHTRTASGHVTALSTTSLTSGWLGPEDFVLSGAGANHPGHRHHPHHHALTSSQSALQLHSLAPAGAGGHKPLGRLSLPGADGIPAAARWTVPSDVFTGRTVVLNFRDPAIPVMLRQFVKSDVRLLRMYESGLPAWAVLLPSYGLWYRPWLRRATWLLFTLISVFSCALGFYDLYKNVPVVRQAMSALSARLFPSAQQLFEWLERHAQVRLSILLTYIFSKSPLFMSLMRLLRSGMALLTQLMAPTALWLHSLFSPALTSLGLLASSIASALAPAWAALCACVAPLGSGLMSVLQPIAGGLGAVVVQLGSLGSLFLGPPIRALAAMLTALYQALLLFLQLGKGMLTGPVYAAMQLRSVMVELGGMITAQLVTVGQMLGSAWQVVKAGGMAAVPAARAAGKTAAAAASVAKAAASTPGGASGAARSVLLLSWVGQEVWNLLEFLQSTLYRCMKALQAVLNFLAAVGMEVNRHRVSLLLQLQRFIMASPRHKYLPGAVARHLPPATSVSLSASDAIGVLAGPEALAAAAAAGLLDGGELASPGGPAVVGEMSHQIASAGSGSSGHRSGHLGSDHLGLGSDQIASGNTMEPEPYMDEGED